MRKGFPSNSLFIKGCFCLWPVVAALIACIFYVGFLLLNRML